MKSAFELGKERRKKDQDVIEGVYGEIGLLDDNGNVSAVFPDPSKLTEVWVRINGDQNRAVVAVNHKVTPKARLPVRIRQNQSKRWEILDTEPLRNTEFMGEAAPSANLPVLVGDALNVILNSEQFRPGRIRPLTGEDLQFFMEELPYTDKILGGVTVDASTEVGTITSGKKALFVFSVDPNNNTLSVTKGADVGIPAPIVKSLAYDVVIPTGDIILGAYIISEGATVPPTTRLAADPDFFYDLRPWITLGSGGGSMNDFTVAADTGTPATIGDGDTLTFAGGTGLSSSISGTTVTTNLDNTAVTPASYAAADITVDAQGRITAAASAASTGTGNVVRASSPTIVTPTIADLTNMQHDHLDGDDGGTLSAAAIASGQLPLARGGTGADLSATGGANQFVKQSSSGANFTVGTIADADVPDALTISGGTINNTPIGASTPSTGAFTNTSQTTYRDLTETSTPSTPTTNHIRDWAADDQGFSVLRWMGSPGVVYTIGRDSFVVAKNTTGGTLADYSIVYLSGSSGVDNGEIGGLARANAIGTLAHGIVRGSTANNAYGIVQIAGMISPSSINGTGFGRMYLDDASTNNMVSTPPSAAGSYVQLIGNRSSASTTGDFILSFEVIQSNNLDGSAITGGTVAAARLGTMTGATFSAGGSKGAAPAPATKDDTKLLSGAATYIRAALTLFSQDADVTVASPTVAETTITGTGLGSLTIPANALNEAGREFEIRAQGYATRAAGNTTIKIKVGGTTIFTFGASATAWGTNNRFEIYAKFTTKTTGATGTIKGQGYVDTFTAVNAFARNAFVATAATTLDLTGTLAVDVTWQWSSNTGQSVTCTNLDVIQVAA